MANGSAATLRTLANSRVGHAGLIIGVLAAALIVMTERAHNRNKQSTEKEVITQSTTPSKQDQKNTPNLGQLVSIKSIKHEEYPGSINQLFKVETRTASAVSSPTPASSKQGLGNGADIPVNFSFEGSAPNLIRALEKSRSVFFLFGADLVVKDILKLQNNRLVPSSTADSEVSLDSETVNIGHMPFISGVFQDYRRRLGVQRIVRLGLQISPLTKAKKISLVSDAESPLYLNAIAQVPDGRLELLIQPVCANNNETTQKCGTTTRILWD
jgi:hypothetical protein